MWDVWNAGGQFIGSVDSIEDAKLLAKDTCWDSTTSTYFAADAFSYVLARQQGTKLLFKVRYQNEYDITYSDREVQ